MNQIMSNRLACVGGEWKDEGEGYFTLVGSGVWGSPLGYVAIPEDHPDVGKDYDSLSPNVNGGLTFGEGNVFGWDYAHAENRLDLAGDLSRAVAYFKLRATVWGRAWLWMQAQPDALRWKLYALRWRVRRWRERVNG